MKVKLVDYRQRISPDYFTNSSWVKVFLEFTCYWELTDKHGHKYIDEEEIRDQETVHIYASLISYAIEDLK